MSRSSAFRVTIAGDRELSKRLEALEKKVAAKAVKQAARPAMKVVLAKVRAEAPKESGTLRRYTKLRVLRAGKRKRKTWGVGIFTPTRDKLGEKGAGKWYYPAHVHYGHKKRGGGGRVEGVPYLRDPLRKLEPRVRRIFRVRLWRIVKGEASK